MYKFELIFNIASHNSAILLTVVKINSIDMCLYLLELLWKAKKWKVMEVEHAII